jgi:phosphatidylserine/phosphatidylglycerophosphate/cardiolipin synthase-like enzyme
MLKTGQAVGSMQAYFLNETVKVNPKTDVDQQATADLQNAAQQTAELLATFIGAAKFSVHIAIYDFRLTVPAIESIVVGAINDAAKRGVTVRIAYDKTQDNPTLKNFAESGGDPAPVGTHTFLTTRGRFDSKVHVKAVRHASAAAIREGIDPKSQIMHHKYVLRDGMTPKAAILMGSANFTVDAWALQENNILVIEKAPQLVQAYERDFGELWASGVITGTGTNDSARVMLGKTPVEVVFAPGQGATIDADITKVILGATRRLYVASMVISSGAVMGAITDRIPQVKEFGGIYDETEMRGVEHAWTAPHKVKGVAKPPSPASKAKFQQWRAIRPELHLKQSIGVDKTHTQRPHSYMHDKIAVADDTVVTGSFNFSTNATHNAENILIINNAVLADQYADYIRRLLKQYPQTGAK